MEVSRQRRSGSVDRRNGGGEKNEDEETINMEKSAGIGCGKGRHALHAMKNDTEDYWGKKVQMTSGQPHHTNLKMIWMYKCTWMWHAHEFIMLTMVVRNTRIVTFRRYLQFLLFLGSTAHFLT